MKATTSTKIDKHDLDDKINSGYTPEGRTRQKNDAEMAKDETNGPERSQDASIGDSDETGRLRTENADLKNQLEEREAQLNWYRQKVDEMQPTNAWPATEDKEMERDLNNLERRIRKFSRDYAVKSIGKRSLRKMFFREGEADESWRVGEVDEMLRNEIWAKFREADQKETAPWLLLSAWLNRFICIEMIMKSFWFMGSFVAREYQRADLVLHRINLDLLSGEQR